MSKQQSFVPMGFVALFCAYAATVAWANAPETADAAAETQSQPSSEAQLLQQTDHLNIQRFETGLRCASQPLPPSWRVNLQERRDRALASCLDCKDGDCTINAELDTLETRYCAQTFCAPIKIVKYAFLDHFQVSDVEVWGTYKINKRGRVADVQVLATTSVKVKTDVAKKLLQGSLNNRRFRPLVIDGKKHEVHGLVAGVKWGR